MAKRKGRKQQATLGSVVVVLILLAVWYFLPPAEEAPAVVRVLTSIPAVLAEISSRFTAIDRQRSKAFIPPLPALSLSSF